MGHGGMPGTPLAFRGIGLALHVPGGTHRPIMRLLFLLPLLLATVSAQDAGTLAGRVTDAETGEPIPGANVIVEGTRLGAATDLDGHYRIIGIPGGEYEVTARYVGYETGLAEAVRVEPGATARQDYAMALADVDFDCCYGCYLSRPMIDRDPFASRSLSGEEIGRLPVER